MINYRYRIIEKLGEGGGGEIFLAEDIVDRSRVALKLLSGTVAGQINEDLFRKEFSLLSTLTHPNLVQVFDVATVMHSDEAGLSGRRFYTMEYLDAKDALAYLHDIPPGKSRASLLESAFIQTLGALDHIHREGIIHFDVKPQNLLVVDGPSLDEISIKLTDFGLSESKLEGLDTPVRGTLEYTAPEIVQGFAIDHRLDLYSLGVTFFHLWMGQCPFRASSPIELLKKVLSENLPPVSRFREYPSILPELIEALCRKKPEERPGSARDVMMSFASTRHEDLVKKCLYLGRQSRAIGRRKDIEFIESIIEESQGPGRSFKVVVVSGAQGIGKSLLLKEVSRRARSKGIMALELNHHPVSRLLRQLRLDLRAAGFHAGQSDEALTGAAIENADGGDDTSRREIDAPERAAISVRLLEEASANCPFVLIIDDLDHASPESAEIMKLIVERSSAPGLVIVVSVSDDRSEWISDDTARFAHLILEELSPDETLELMKYRLGQPFASSGIVPNLYDLFGGIPMVILEEIKLIANALPLAVINDHRTLSGMTGQLEEFLSMNLEAMVSVRFQTLRPEEKLILQWISCFEEPCDIEILSEVLALRRGVLEENVTALEQRGFIRPAGPSDHPDHDKSGRGGRMDSPATPSDAAERKKVNRRRFRIRHRRLQSYVYNVVIKDHNHYHHSIAVVLDKAKGRDAWTDLKELGRQWDLCGESVKARACYEEASTKAPTHSDTAEMLKKALACLPEDRQERTTALMIRLAQALFAAASYRESVEIWEEILNRLTGDDERRLAAHTSIGKSFSRLGGNAKALQHFDEALSRAAADTDRFEIRQEIVALKIADGQYDEAVQLSERQRVFAARHPDRQLLASVETDLGIAQFYKGNVHESLKSFETTFTISKECKNTGKTIDALNNIGNVLSVMKDFRGALEKWRHALELITDPGPQHQRAQIFNNMGIAHSKLREFEEARSCYERAQKIFGSLGSENGVALTLTNLGEVVYADGNYERSLHLWTEALQMYREMQDSGSMAQTLLQLTQVYCTLGDANVASRMLGEAETLIQKSGLSTLEPLLCFLKGSVHAASNRYGEAAREYNAAAKGFQQNGSITGGTESELEKKLLALLRRAEMSRLLRQSDDIAETLGRIRAVDSKSISPLVTAETALTLGVLSRDYPVLVESRPLVFFRQGRELIEREQVSEISWKISCELGREYAKRGNAEKARENFLNAKLVIEYFASRITDDLARNRYLAADHRSEILAEAMEYQSS